MKISQNYIYFDGFYSQSNDAFYYIYYDKKQHKTGIRRINNPNIEVYLTKPTTKIRYFIKKDTLDTTKIPLIKKELRYKYYTFLQNYLSDIYSSIGDIELTDFNKIVVDNFKNNAVINILTQKINKIEFGKYFKNEDDAKFIKSLLNLEYEIYNDIRYYTYFIKSNNIDISEIVDYQAYSIFDIEVLTDGEFPDIDNPTGKIISISYYINKPNNKTYYLLYIPPKSNINTADVEKKLLENIKQLKNIDLVDDIVITPFNDELLMIVKFLYDIKDTLTLHAINGHNFDIPYLFNRLQFLIDKYKKIPENKEKIEKILDFLKKYFLKLFPLDEKNKNTDRIVVKNNNDVIRLGVVNYIDFLKMIEFQFGSNFLEKQSLEYIASKVLDETYLVNGDKTFKVNISDIAYTYKNKLVDFLLYSFKDTYLLVEIERNLQTINFIYTLKSIIPFELSNLGVGNIISAYFYNQFSDQYLILNNFKKNFYSKKIFKIYSTINSDFGYSVDIKRDVNDTEYRITIDYIDDKIKIENKENDSSYNDIRYYSFIKSINGYIGAFVKSPDAGLYDNVIDFDASSLYPTLIYNFNISHDTLIMLIPEKLAIFILYEDKDKIEKLLNDYGDTKIKIYDDINDEIKELSINNIYKIIMTKKYILTPAGSVRKNPILDENKSGFIRKSEEIPIKYRKIYKKKMNEYPKKSIEYIKYDGIQQVYKKIANSIYGIGGDKTSRFFNLLYAVDITASGRSLILYTSYYVNHLLSEISSTKPLDNG